MHTSLGQMMHLIQKVIKISRITQLLTMSGTTNLTAKSAPQIAIQVINEILDL